MLQDEAVRHSLSMSSRTPRRCVPGAQGPGCSCPLYAPMKEFKVIDMCGYFSFLNNNKFLTHALLWTSFSVLNLIDYSERRIHDIRTLLRWCKKSSLGHRTGPRLDFLELAFHGDNAGWWCDVSQGSSCQAQCSGMHACGTSSQSGDTESFPRANSSSSLWQFLHIKL